TETNVLRPAQLGKRTDDDNYNVFVAEFDSKGNPKTANYFVLLSGSRADFGQAIAPAYGIGSKTEFFIAGSTYSNNAADGFPTPGTLLPFNGATNGTADGFVALLAPEAGPRPTSLLFNTYIGGSGTREPRKGDASTGVAVDGNGNVYVTGLTNSADFIPPT